MTIQVVFLWERGGVSAPPKLLLFPFNKLKISVIPSEARNLITLVCYLLGLNSTEKIIGISSILTGLQLKPVIPGQRTRLCGLRMQSF
jgi:hypothetical protein